MTLLQGGLKAMGESLARGHVLVMSLWDDHLANMLWLDAGTTFNREDLPFSLIECCLQNLAFLSVKEPSMKFG